MLSGLFTSAMPMIKTGLVSLGKQALRTGMDIAGDMADGQGFSESANRRVREGIKRLVRPADDIVQTGNGRRKRCQRKKKIVKRRKLDIFE